MVERRICSARAGERADHLSVEFDDERIADSDARTCAAESVSPRVRYDGVGRNVSGVDVDDEGEE